MSKQDETLSITDYKQHVADLHDQAQIAINRLQLFQEKFSKELREIQGDFQKISDLTNFSKDDK